MSKNELADKLAKGVRRALHPSEPAAAAVQPPAAPPTSAARPAVPAPRRADTASELHPARIWPD